MKHIVCKANQKQKKMTADMQENMGNKAKITFMTLWWNVTDLFIYNIVTS